MVKIPITIPGLASAEYTVVVGAGILMDELRQIANHGRLVVFVDATIATLHRHILTTVPSDHIYEVTADERHKHLDTLSKLWTYLHDSRADRQTIVVNIGGGVMGDIGGFAASTYMRGLRFVQVPTTLLSMVDASVGGKTGMNHSGVKNLVGSFQQPISVIADTDMLATLPPRELASGYSEMIKHGLIADPHHYAHLQQSTSLTPNLIVESIQVKKSIVESDPHERGIRKVLNFGHTVGHALEAYSHATDRPLLHGEAIALGMVVECAIAEKLTGLDPSIRTSLVTSLTTHQLPTRYPDVREHIDHIVQLMRSDKKNIDGAMMMSLIERIGTCRYDVTVTTPTIEHAIREIL